MSPCTSGDAAAISVVVCTHFEDRLPAVFEAVESVRAQTVPAHEAIVVVDRNASLRGRLASALRDVTVVANTKSPGLSGARNTGVARAAGSVVAFLDDDAVAAPDWLEHLARGYSDPRVVAVGGAVEPVWERSRPGFFPREFDWVVGCTYEGLPTAARPVRNLIGANMSFRREVFAEVGGFDSRLGRVGTHPAGCEETELCIRLLARRPGGVVVYEPRAIVRHRVPVERATWAYFVRRCFAEGRSKARVASQRGFAALRTERSYTFRTVPRGIRRAVAEARRGDPSGIARVGALVAGTGVTVAGYGVGHVGVRLGQARLRADA